MAAPAGVSAGAGGAKRARVGVAEEEGEEEEEGKERAVEGSEVRRAYVYGSDLVRTFVLVVGILLPRHSLASACAGGSQAAAAEAAA